MNYTQQELADLCPEDVAEFIDNEVLPEYADGFNTAENVADFMIDEAIDRLRILEIDCTTYYNLYAKIALIDPYITLSQNRKILVAYIQTVFDNWSEEIMTSLKKSEIASILKEEQR